MVALGIIDATLIREFFPVWIVVILHFYIGSSKFYLNPMFFVHFPTDTRAGPGRSIGPTRQAAHRESAAATTGRHWGGATRRHGSAASLRSVFVLAVGHVGGRVARAGGSGRFCRQQPVIRGMISGRRARRRAGLVRVRPCAAACWRRRRGRRRAKGEERLTDVAKSGGTAAPERNGPGIAVRPASPRSPR